MCKDGFLWLFLIMWMVGMFGGGLICLIENRKWSGFVGSIVLGIMVGLGVISFWLNNVCVELWKRGIFDF